MISSFAALSVSLAMRSAELADGLVREMLRPMLKQWLDENLPAIVERLVRAEIQRVARGAEVSDPYAQDRALTSAVTMGL